ncbi:MAG: AMP-binding protein, partial [Isosphaeraceae bacterium]
MNVASALSVVARDRPDVTAVVCRSGRDAAGRPTHTRWSFQRLDRESDVLARGLSEIGIGRGVRTVLMVTPGLEFFALTFALFKAGAVPVLIDPGMGVRNLGRCLAEAAPEAFIGIPRAQLAWRLLGWARHTLRTTVTVRPGGKARPTRPGRGVRHLSLADVQALGESPDPFPAAATTAEETAAILLTSGSTGPPKGAVYT